MLVFAATALMAAVMVLFLPETQGTELPDDVEQAERIGKKGIVYKLAEVEEGVKWKYT